MKGYKILILVCLLSTGLIGVRKSLPSDILPPQIMEIDNERIYLATGTSVSILNVSDFKLIKSFGKKGEGPGEFITITSDRELALFPLKNSLFVNSMKKISYFTKNGEFIRELKVKDGFFHKPLSNNLVGINNKMDKKILYSCITIYDRNYNIIKEVHRKKFWFQRGKKIDPVNVRLPRYCVYKDLLITMNSNNNFSIFDKNGKNLYKTNVKLNLLKLTEEDKRDYHNYYKTHPLYKEDYANIKHLIKFPKYFPPVKFFDVSDSKLYVFTYNKKGNKNEIYIFDLKGKLIKKIYIKMVDIKNQEVYPLIRVKNGKIYQITENIDDEDELDLVITDLSA